MWKVVMTAMVIICLTAISLSNPLPEPLITEVSVDPPWIEISYSYINELEGEYIYTTNGVAEIYAIEMEHGPVVFDSSNCSGFVLNPDGDSISFSFYNTICNEVGYGFMGELAGPPPAGYSITHKLYQEWNPEYGWYDVFYYFSFCDEPTPGTFEYSIYETPFWGTSALIINEINLACNWNQNSNFIELYNAGYEIVSTDDYYIVGDTFFALPENVLIFPGEYYIVNEADCPELFTDKNQDVLYLVKRNDDYDHIIDIIDQVGWSDYFTSNTSFMRYPDGDVNWSNDSDFLGYNTETSYTFEEGFPTRGAANRHESPGFVPIAARADSIDEGVARITWTDPIWDELFDYSVLVKSYDGYADLPADGDVIYTGTEQQFVDDSVLPEVISYYTVFAYSTEGDYSTPTDESRDYIYFNNVGIDDHAAMAEDHSLLACYPNPFNAQTKIDFTITQPGKVQLAIYDITGRLIETLTDEYYSAGRHSIIWNAERYSSGVYFTRLNSKDGIKSEKMVLMK